MTTLLSKVRAINRMLQYSGGEPVKFGDLAKVLSEVIGANVYILSSRGKILGYELMDDYECDLLEKQITTGEFPREYNQSLLEIRETLANNQETDQCVFCEDYECIDKSKLTTIVPIYGRGQRLGTLLMARFRRRFDEEDLVLGEFGAAVVAMEMLRAQAEEQEKESRKKAVVKLALDTLSYSEMEALEHILRELDGSEGLLVASKIADEVGITRSVIVNALRKLESAGVIESRSLGMKGTYIKVLNDNLFAYLNL